MNVAYKPILVTSSQYKVFCIVKGDSSTWNSIVKRKIFF
jgi:hypothetical protein